MFQIPAEPVPHVQPAPNVASSLTEALIGATVQIDQPSGDGVRVVGAGFLLDAPRPDGSSRTLLVTAEHVLEGMPAADVRIGWRTPGADGGWRFDPQPLRIRDDADPLWTAAPGRDVAVMEIVAPPAFAHAAIPLDWLAGADTFETARVGPGDEMLTLGFPRGLAANRAGFPVLRAGRIASWPLTPIAAFPTFLLDFAVFPGNSGGPVFWTPSTPRTSGDGPSSHPYVAGVLTREVTVQDERLGIAVVAHADYIREAVALLDRPEPIGP